MKHEVQTVDPAASPDLSRLLDIMTPTDNVYMFKPTLAPPRAEQRRHWLYLCRATARVHYML